MQENLKNYMVNIFLLINPQNFKPTKISSYHGHCILVYFGRETFSWILCFSALLWKLILQRRHHATPFYCPRGLFAKILLCERNFTKIFHCQNKPVYGYLGIQPLALILGVYSVNFNIKMATLSWSSSGLHVQCMLYYMYM